jgi:uncharacterized protein DUF3307
MLIPFGLSGVVFAQLILGHSLADFVLPNGRMLVAKKTKVSALLARGLSVFFVYMVACLPFFSPRIVLQLALLSLIHLAIDRLKIFMDGVSPRPVTWFLFEQVLHVASLVAFVLLTKEEIQFIVDLSAEPVIRFSILAAALAFNGRGAAFLIGRLLHGKEPLKPGADALNTQTVRLGGLIGVLERSLLILLLTSGEWAAAGFVLAAKSIARFKDLEERAFSEYYLVGTLASFLIAVLTVLALRGLAFG